MSAAELMAGFQAVQRRFLSSASVRRRLAHSPVGLWWTLPVNLAYAWRLWRAGGTEN